MAFDSGSVSFRLFYLQRTYDTGLVDAFAKNAAPAITSLNKDPPHRHAPHAGWLRRARPVHG